MIEVKVREVKYPNGQLMFRCSYKNDKLDGLYECWYPNGQLQFRANYKNGNIHGLNEWWYENGQQKVRVNVKNDKLDGVFEEWDENGKLIESRTYKDGIKVSAKSNKNIVTSIVILLEMLTIF